MKINEINIAEFGCLKNIKLSFDGRMNIIYGDNEAGKSTVLLFIKFMLYGLGRRAANNSDRERSISWSGHTAAGSMTISHGGKNYRIERRYTEASRGGNEKLSVICLDDGSEIDTPNGVGEYFLGVPKEVFESSACVGQLASSDINGEKTSASIQNMMTSADESVDTAKILKNLDSVRVSYRHKNKTGGSLYEMEQQLSELRQKLERAREANLSLDDQTQKLNAARREYEIVKRDFDEKDRLISELNKINLLKRFEKYHSMEAQLDELASKKNKCKADKLKTDFFPERNHVAELKLSAKALYEAEAELDKKLAEREKIAVAEYDEKLAALGEKIEQNGGADAILRTIAEKKKFLKGANLATVGCWLGGVAGLAVGIGLVISGQYWAAAFAALPIAALIVTLVSAKKKKAAKQSLHAIYDEYSTEAATLSQKLADCLKALASRRSYESVRAMTDAALDEARKVKDRAKQNVAELLAKTLVGTEPTYDNAVREQTRIAEFIIEYEDICKEEQMLTRLIEGEREALSHYDEAELKEAISIDISLVTPTLISDSERQRTFLLRKKEAFEQKIFALNDQVVQLRANAADPLPIADAVAELEEKYKRDNEFYSALALAMESIEKAGEVMKGSVMPAVLSQASEFIARISADRYTALRATGNFALSLDNDGFRVKADYLSSGTRDAAYLSLRMALFMRIFGGELPPLVLDEAFCQFDNVRAERMIEMLGELAKNDIQCLLFTSHRREAELCEQLKLEYADIILEKCKNDN